MWAQRSAVGGSPVVQAQLNPHTHCLLHRALQQVSSPDDDEEDEDDDDVEHIQLGDKVGAQPMCTHTHTSVFAAELHRLYSS